MVAIPSLAVHATVVESFDSGALGSGWVTARTQANLPAFTASAAHDGAYGLSVNSLMEWIYNDSIRFGAGSTLSAWIRPHFGIAAGGRIYLGYGADSAGARSLDAAPNTHQLLLMDHSGYGYADLATVGQSYLSNSWYLLSVTLSADGAVALGRLYAGDGSTLLNSVSFVDAAPAATGIALRVFGGFDMDTVSITSAVPEPATVPMLLGGLAGMAGVLNSRRGRSLSGRRLPPGP